jgi:hypothetical protein
MTQDVVGHMCEDESIQCCFGKRGAVTLGRELAGGLGGKRIKVGFLRWTLLRGPGGILCEMHWCKDQHRAVHSVDS